MEVANSIDTTFNFRYYVLTVLGKKIRRINWKKFNDYYYIDFLTEDNEEGSAFPEYTDDISNRQTLGYVVVIGNDVLESVSIDEFEVIQPVEEVVEYQQYIHKMLKYRKRKANRAIFRKLAKIFVNNAYGLIPDVKIIEFVHKTENNVLARFGYSKN